MKRLLFALIVLLAAPAWAGEPVQLARMSGPMLGAGVSAAVANGKIGTIAAESVSTSTTANRAYWSTFEPTDVGVVEYCHLYIKTSDKDENICICIWDASGAKLSCTNTTTINVDNGNWLNVKLSAPVTLVAETSYRVGFGADAVFDYSVSGGVGSGLIDADYAYSCGDSVETTGTMLTRTLRVLCDNQSGDPE